MGESDTMWRRDGHNVEDLPDPFAAPAFDYGGAVPPDTVQPSKPRRRRWRYVFYGFSALLLVTLLWLIITAPLGRALEPLDDPALLLLSKEGLPIARRGAIKDEPVEVAKLNQQQRGEAVKDVAPAAAAGPGGLDSVGWDRAAIIERGRGERIGQILDIVTVAPPHRIALAH